MIDDMTPRQFLRASAFSPEKAAARFPRARRLTVGGLFVSHAGADTSRIQDHIIRPVVYGRFPADGYFMHSRSSDGAKEYRELVQAALHWCDKMLVVISEISVRNLWVQAEVEWALERSRPVLAACFDHKAWHHLLHELELSSSVTVNQAVQTFDFSDVIENAQRQLGRSLDKLLVGLPRHGLDGLG